MKKVIVIIITILITLFVGFYESYVEYKLASNSNIIALMLHSVDEKVDKEVSRVIITPQKLNNNIKYLKEKGYNFVDGSDVANILLDDKSNKGSKNIWLTFDDGYRDNYYNLFPILKQNDIKATVNLIVKYVEEDDYTYPGRYLTWEMVDEMNRSGLVEFGCHSYDSHNMVVNLKGKYVPSLKSAACLETGEEFFNRVLNDFSNAKGLMQERIGEQIDIIAYPYGASSEITRSIADYVGFKIELGIKNGYNDKVTDMLDIKRINISNDYTEKEIEKIINYYRGLSILLH